MAISPSFHFILYIITAFTLFYIPIVSWPFSWAMTYFHEISHGIAAILTGGKIQSIQLHLRGSGLCTTVGGIHFIILWFGYTGAVIWGVIMYMMADTVSVRYSKVFALLLSSLVLVSALLWGRDLITLLIMFLLLSLLMLAIRFSENAVLKSLLKFIGIYVLLDAVRAPLYLIDGRHLGDGAQLANITGIPEIIWIIIWLLVGVIGIYLLWRYHRKTC